MVGWHHQLDGHEFEQTLGDGEGQGSLACCSPWGHKESDMTQLMKNAKVRGWIEARERVGNPSCRIPEKIFREQLEE